MTAAAGALFTWFLISLGGSRSLQSDREAVVGGLRISGSRTDFVGPFCTQRTPASTVWRLVPAVCGDRVDSMAFKDPGVDWPDLEISRLNPHDQTHTPKERTWGTESWAGDL